MNAKFLERLIEYREQYRIDIAKTIIEQKIRFQFSVVKQRKIAIGYVELLQKSQTIQEILLIEARAAKHYWSCIEKNIQEKIAWYGRKPHAEDPANKLIDIGYHYLNQKLTTIFKRLEVPYELGFFHTAQSAQARPLVYDFMEWLRPVVVDRIFITIVRKKKKRIEKVTSKDISYFLSKIKLAGETMFFQRKLGYCISLDYWIEILLLEFMGCINSRKSYHPLFPSLRNENRCNKKTTGG